MTLFSSVINKFLRVVVMSVVLFCFVGLTTIHQWTLPLETPRSAILRLSGFDIAPPATWQISNASTPLTKSHLHKAVPKHQQPHSHHVNMHCPLCPLLTFSVAVLVAALCAFLLSFACAGHKPGPRSTRGPPQRLFFLRPPARGPPLSLPV